MSVDAVEPAPSPFKAALATVPEVRGTEPARSLLRAILLGTKVIVTDAVTAARTMDEPSLTALIKHLVDVCELVYKLREVVRETPVEVRPWHGSEG